MPSEELIELVNAANRLYDVEVELETSNRVDQLLISASYGLEMSLDERILRYSNRHSGGKVE